MGKIIISDNVSLNGVIQDPVGDEGFRVGGWVGVIAGRPELAKVTLDEALGTEALLLGRRSYEWLAARWPSRTGALADRLNSLPKYVVSSTLEDPRWNNSAVLKGDVVTEVSKLKQELNGEIQVPASFQLTTMTGRWSAGIAGAHAGGAGAGDPARCYWLGGNRAYVRQSVSHSSAWHHDQPRRITRARKVSGLTSA